MLKAAHYGHKLYTASSVGWKHMGLFGFISRANESLCHFVETISEMTTAQFTTNLRNDNVISYWGLPLF